MCVVLNQKVASSVAACTFATSNLTYEDREVSEMGGSGLVQLCEQCAGNKEPFDLKPDLQEWTNFKMTDPSWAQWRKDEGLES